MLVCNTLCHLAGKCFVTKVLEYSYMSAKILEVVTLCIYVVQVCIELYVAQLQNSNNYISLAVCITQNGKQTADCESPHDWLMSLPMDLAVFSKDVAFACHFVVPRPQPSHPIGVLVVLTMPVKNYIYYDGKFSQLSSVQQTVNYLEQLQIRGETHAGSSNQSQDTLN